MNDLRTGGIDDGRSDGLSDVARFELLDWAGTGADFARVE